MQPISGFSSCAARLRIDLIRSLRCSALHPDLDHLDRRISSRGFSAAPLDPGTRLQRLLAWMAGQDFQLLVDSGLLRQVEKIVVEGHHALYTAEGKAWSPPIAYRWLRYEDPTPVASLIDGTRRLRRRGAEFDAGAVEKACAEASKKGFLN